MRDTARQAIYVESSMHKLTMALAAAATAAAVASPAVAETVYVYRDPGFVTPESRVYAPVTEPRVYAPVTEPRVYAPVTPSERLYVDRPYYAYDSYYVWDPVLRRYEPRYRYRVVDDSGRSYPVTAHEADRLYGYPHGFDGNPGYLVWDGHRIGLAPDHGVTRDSNPDLYSSGHYNPRP